MTARLVLPRMLRAGAGGAHELVVHGATLGDVLDGLAQRVPVLERRIRDERGVIRPHVIIYVDGIMVGGSHSLETAIGEGSEVFIAPAVSGG